MARVKVRLADQIARVIFIDPEATKGATLGSTLYDADGVVTTRASLRTFLGLGTDDGTLAHSALSGLQVGDDHPQYTMWADKESITGQWNFATAVWGADGSAATPEFTFTSDTDTGMYRSSANVLAFGTGGANRWLLDSSKLTSTVLFQGPTGSASGPAYSFAGDPNTGIYNVSADKLGFAVGGTSVLDIDTTRSRQTVLITKDRNGVQWPTVNWADILFQDSTASTTPNGRIAWDVSGDLHFGANAVPVIGGAAGEFTRDNNANAAFTIELSMFDNRFQIFAAPAGSSHFIWDITTAALTMDGSGNLMLGAGVSSPQAGFLFTSKGGIYVQSGGVTALAGGLTAAAGNITATTGLFLGANGAVGGPTYSFVGDTNTGIYSISADVLGIATAGVERYRVGASGELGIGGANFGTAGQVFTSGGTSAAPTWTTPASTSSGSSLVFALTAPATVANTAVETAFSGASYTVPANSLAVGSVIRVKQWGVFSTASSAPTLQLKVKFGSTLLLDSGSISTMPASAANLGFTLLGELTVISIGASGSIECQALWELSTAASTGLLVNASRTATVTIDTTTAQAITATAQWGTASASNTITLREMLLSVEQPATISLNPTNITPDTHPTTPNAADDEFEAGTSIDLTGARRSGATSWAWRNQGSATGTVANGNLVLVAPAQALASGPQLRIVEQTTSGSTWKYRAKVSMSPINFVNFLITGMVLVENGTGKCETFGITFDTSFNNDDVAIDQLRFTSVSAFSARPTTQVELSARRVGAGAYIYFEIERTASQLIFRSSTTGVEGTFRQHTAENTNAFFTTAPDRIGIFCDTENSNNAAAATICDWFRQIA